MQISEQTKVMCLAHLKLGKKPKEAAELCDISYSQALKLSKQLIEAERRNAVLELFSLDEAVLNTLLDTVKDNKDISALVSPEVLEGQVEEFKESASGLGILEREMQDTALELTKKIKATAVTTTNADTINSLADSLTKLNSSFFAKGTTVNIASSKFEEYLRD